MKFTAGFEKTAADPIVFSNIGRALGRGAKAAGDSTIKDALKLKGLKHLKDAVTTSGGLKRSFTSQAGRERLAEAVGKASPSLAAGGAYLVGAKKLYNKVSEDDQGYY